MKTKETTIFIVFGGRIRLFNVTIKLGKWTMHKLHHGFKLEVRPQRKDAKNANIITILEEPKPQRSNLY